MKDTFSFSLLEVHINPFCNDSKDEWEMAPLIYQNQF